MSEAAKKKNITIDHRQTHLGREVALELIAKAAQAEPLFVCYELQREAGVRERRAALVCLWGSLGEDGASAAALGAGIWKLLRRSSGWSTGTSGSCVGTCAGAIASRMSVGIRRQEMSTQRHCTLAVVVIVRLPCPTGAAEHSMGHDDGSAGPTVHATAAAGRLAWAGETR